MSGRITRTHLAIKRPFSITEDHEIGDVLG